MLYIVYTKSNNNNENNEELKNSKQVFFLKHNCKYSIHMFSQSFTRYVACILGGLMKLVNNFSTTLFTNCILFRYISMYSQLYSKTK